MAPKAVLEFAAANNVKVVDIRFTDLPGLWHHISFPIQQLDEGSFENGFGIDGSSIRGWASIHESDMLLIPDPTTAFMDPFRDTPTLVMIGDVVDPLTRQSYPRDPRFVARKAEAHLGFSGVGDQAVFEEIAVGHAGQAVVARQFWQVFALSGQGPPLAIAAALAG